MTIARSQVQIKLPQVRITAWWGHDDVDASVTMLRTRWEAILAGAPYHTTAIATYEGQRFTVAWRFRNAQLSVDGADGAQHLVAHPCSELLVQPVPEPGGTS